MKLKTALALAFGMSALGAHAATELVIATVNNGHMIEMQKLTKHFEQANPDIKVQRGPMLLYCAGAIAAATRAKPISRTVWPISCSGGATRSSGR